MNQAPTQAFLPGRIGLLVRLNCEASMRPALLEALNTYADGLQEEPGTEVFVVSLDPDDEGIVWLYEIFKDEDAQRAHQASAGFADLIASMEFLTAPPAVLRFDPIRMSLQEGMLVEDWGF